MFIYTLDHVIPEPSAWLFVSSWPSGVIVRKDWRDPVLTLYLEVAALHPLFLRNMQHRADSLGACFHLVSVPGEILCGFGCAFLQKAWTVSPKLPCDHHRPFSTAARTAVGSRLGWRGARLVFKI